MDRTLWYFGYGSNMDPRTFLGRRRMRPHESCVGRLDGYELCFDLPVGRGERGVANVRVRRAASVWGVVYRISLAQAAHLDRTEGVPHGAYRRIPIDLSTPDGRQLAAFTYRSERGRPGRKPSRRYLGLLLAGARHHGLPEAYVSWLRGLELAHDERDPQQPLFGGQR